MTPEQRRAKYPLPPVTPMTDEELESLRERAEHWLLAPSFTERSLDLTYHTEARLLATIKARETTL